MLTKAQALELVQQNPVVLLILGFVLAVTLAYSIFFRNSKNKSASILLLGASDAGKTAVLLATRYGRALPTHTSMQVNSVSLPSADSKRLRTLVDVPGHLRLRDQFKPYVQNANAIAFVVDCSTIARNGAAVAEYLHLVLHAATSLKPSSRNKTPQIIILAHKKDLVNLVSNQNAEEIAIGRVRTVLERELSKRAEMQKKSVRVEKMGESEGLGQGEEADLGGLDCVGKPGFRFADWEAGEIELIGTSVHVEREDLFSEKKSVQEENVKQSNEGLTPFSSWLEEL